MTPDDYADTDSDYVYTSEDADYPELPPRVHRERLPYSGREARRLERIGLDAPVTPAAVNRPSFTPSVAPVHVETRAEYRCPENGSWTTCLTCRKEGRHYIAFLIPFGREVPRCERHGFLVRVPEASHV
jgi:predicted RNA-binding Zn-ribbon protein involved in translation (DUF1610 family)